MRDFLRYLATAALVLNTVSNEIGALAFRFMTGDVTTRFDAFFACFVSAWLVLITSILIWRGARDVF